MSPTITVEQLSKTYQVPEREGGFSAAVRGFFNRKYKDVKAVQQVDFKIEQGEIVGFLGPNGAGKTTTLKMLSGLLHPTGGTASVLGYTPWELKSDYLRSMTLVMGQRNRLSWDIPAADSFLLNQAIYRIPDDQYQETYKELDELLELDPLMKKPVRNLSLGERMKCEIAAGLLHRPKVLFLDEPTIGLDITGQVRIREFLREYNKRTGATILLTSHYMADVEALCKRVIVIHHGRILFDGDLSKLVNQFSSYKTLSLTLQNPEIDLSKYGEVVSKEDGRVTLRVPKAQTSQVTARLLSDLQVDDLTVEDAPVDDVIDQVFSQKEEA